MAGPSLAAEQRPRRAGRRPCRRRHREHTFPLQVANGDHRPGADLLQQLALGRFERDASPDHLENLQQLVVKLCGPASRVDLVERRGDPTVTRSPHPKVQPLAHDRHATDLVPPHLGRYRMDLTRPYVQRLFSFVVSVGVRRLVLSGRHGLR